MHPILHPLVDTSFIFYTNLACARSAKSTNICFNDHGIPVL